MKHALKRALKRNRIVHRLRGCPHIRCRSWEEAKGRCTGLRYGDDGLDGARIQGAGDVVAPEHPILGPVVRQTGASVIVDLGGGVGEIARGIVTAIPGTSVIIVEQEGIVARARSTPGVTFSLEITPCDVFFTSSCLNYVDDHLSYIEKGFEAAHRAAVFARNAFSERDEFHVQRMRLSKNGPPGVMGDAWTDLAHHTVRESDIVSIGKCHGFDLARRIPAEIEESLTGRSYDVSLVFLKRH
jgi:hypothetical protein